MSNNRCSKCKRFFVINEKREVIDGFACHAICPKHLGSTSVIATGGGQRLAGGQSVNHSAIVSADNEEVNIETTKTLYC